MLMSLVGDVHVTQLVNGHKGIHVMMPKAALQAA
jgi:acetamidase/formamidase